MTAIDKYNQYWESEEEFSYVLRMEYEWYDKKYQEMMKIIRNVFLDYSNSQVIPKSLIYFFTQEIDFVVGIVSNDVFFTTTPDGFTREEYASLVLKRKSELLELKKMFFSGDFYGLSSHSFFI